MAAGQLNADGPGRWSLCGDVGFADAARLLADGEAAFGAADAAQVDLSGVGRLDSAGLALLVEWSLAARRRGCVIRYRNAPPALASLAGIGGVSGLLDSSDG